jgi:hypothetical protein
MILPGAKCSIQTFIQFFRTYLGTRLLHFLLVRLYWISLAFGDETSRQLWHHHTADWKLIKMDAPTFQPKFLPKQNELGLVAVGFSGGQVGQ